MKIPHLRWYIAGLLFASSVINYIDRQTLSVVAPVLVKELRLSQQDYANIVQAFLIAYTVMYLVSGWITDRWGTRLALASFMSWWSAANALHALANSVLQLGFFRFLLGAGESGNFMAATKAASEWYPPKERALVNGLVNAGASVGAIIAAPLIVWLTLQFGWRNALVITGSIGFLWVTAWLFFYYLPEKHPRITGQELETIRALSPSAGGQARPRWLELLRLRQTWGLLLSRFVSDPVWWFYLFWLPKYLVEQRGFTLVEMGMLAWMPYLSADLGAIAGGLCSGYLVKKHWPVLTARKAAMLPCALLMPASLIIAFSPSNVLVMAVICLVTFSHMAWKTNLMTMTNDIFPTRMVGSVAGVVAFGSGLGAAVFINLAGRIISLGSYNLVFIIMGFLHPAAFVIVQLLVKGELGQRRFDNNYRLDGISMIGAFVNGSTYVPSLEALEEVSVETGQYSSAFGSYSGAQVNMVVKSGGNQVHGSLYEYLRNNALNARNFFDVQDPPPFRYNQFGATIGGPVYVPRVYSGKDRSFFFFGYEGIRVRRQSTGQGTVPTDAMRRGNFSALLPGRAIVDPFVGIPAASISGFLGTGENFSNPRLLYSAPPVQNHLHVQLTGHTLRFGGEYFRRRQDFFSINARNQGAFSFTGRLSGNSYADFLLGLPKSTAKIDVAPNSSIHQRHTAAYVQDDWRATPGAVDSRRPSPQYSSIRVFSTDAVAYYNGLQTRLQTRNWHGLNLLTGYTWSKCIDIASNPATSSVGTEDSEPQNQYDRHRGQRGRCAIDFTHVFKVHGVYEIPLSRVLTGLANKVLGGWRMSASLNLQSGEPFSITVSGNPANTGSSWPEWWRAEEATWYSRESCANAP